MFKVKIQSQSCGCRHHAIAVEDHELAIVEQLHVPQVMVALETLLIGKRGEAGDLQRLHLWRELRARMRHYEPPVNLSVVPAQWSSPVFRPCYRSACNANTLFAPGRLAPKNRRIFSLASSRFVIPAPRSVGSGRLEYQHCHTRPDTAN